MQQAHMLLVLQRAERRCRFEMAVEGGNTQCRHLRQGFEALLAGQTALGRVGEPNDVGCMVASLLSSDNRWINAQNIEISGGYII